MKSFTIAVFSDVVTRGEEEKGGRGWEEEVEEGEREEKKKQIKKKRIPFVSGNVDTLKTMYLFPPVKLKQGIQIRTYKSQPEGTFP